MAGLRGLVVGLVLSSAMVSIPARAQIGASVSLTHTVSVTVPPRVKVQVANLAVPAIAPSRVSSSQVNVGGLSLAINASQAWVLAIGSASSSSARKSQLQWSSDGKGFSTITSMGAAVTSSVTGYQVKGANLYFRNGGSLASQTGGTVSAEPVVLTITAP